MRETNVTEKEHGAHEDKKRTSFNVRDSLRSVAAIRSYDSYVLEHKRRLRQLESLAKGDLTPSGEWYR
mgnify:CR=1 FL=1